MESCWACSCWTPDGVQQLHAQQLSTYTKPGFYCSFRLLMMGGVSPETRRASYKYEIKFSYTVASCWIFYMNYGIAMSLTATSSTTNPTCTVCEIQPRPPQCWTGDSPHELWHCLNYCSSGRVFSWSTSVIRHQFLGCKLFLFQLIVSHFVLNFEVSKDWVSVLYIRSWVITLEMKRSDLLRSSATSRVKCWSFCRCRGWRKED